MPRSAPALAAAVLVCAPAHAHSGFAGMSDFWNGALHLIFAVEQAITLLALGLAMARLESDKVAAPFHIYLIAFSVALVGGVALLPVEAEVLRPLPMILAGFLLIDPGDRTKTLPRAAVGAGAFAAGLSFGSAVPEETSRYMFAGGMFLGAVLLPTYAMLAWEQFYHPWFRIAIRIAGSWLAAIGIILLGATFR